MGITASPPAVRPGLMRVDAVLLRLQLIGRMQALTLDNRSVLPLGRKTRALLAILALSNRKPVLRQRLAELLWSRRSEEQARASLRQEIHRLLDALSPLGAEVVAVDRHMLALKSGLTSVDAERLLNAQPGHSGALPSLDGVLLEELNGTDPALDLWLRTERQRLRQHALSLFETVLDRPRDPQGVLEGARQLLLIDPLHEAAWRATIRSRQVLGETALAREAAERFAALLAERPSPPPSPESLLVLSEFGGTVRPAEPPAAPEGGGPDDAAPPRPGSASLAADPPPDAKRRRRPGLPLVAILPLIDLNGRNDRRPLTHGIATALRAEMAPHGFLRVLSGSDLDTGLEDDRDDASLRRRFGIDYVLDGTIQGEGDQVRAVIRLTDIRQHGQIVWGRRFTPGIPRNELLEHVVARVAAEVPSELMLLESHRLRRRPMAEMEPEQLSLRAFSAMITSDRRQMREAQSLLDRSVSLGIETPLARMIDALAHLFAALQGWDLPASAERASQRSAAALEGTPGSVLALALRVLLRSELDNEPEAALALADRCDALQPCAFGTLASVFPLIRLGRLREARSRYDAGRAVLPIHPFDMVLDLPGPMLALLEGRPEEAARLGLLASELHPCFAPALVCHLAALGQLDRTRDAARVRRQLQALWPDASVAMLVERAGLRDPEHAARLADGLRRAGLDDETDGHGPPAGRADGAALGAPGAAG